jgi:DNA-binding LacI/PurR family transcriptional regulator
MAYREALRRQGITYDENIVKNCNWDLTLCGQYTEDLLNSENPPDAIFAGSDTLAAVVLGKIFAMGLHCPKDVSVIGFNNLAMSEHTIPPLTTIEVPTKEIGKIVIRRLYELLSGKDDLILNISLPVKLILRESTEVKKK